jgi:hypothetical protein
MAHEITISWDKSPSAGATYNIYRGTAHGNESAVPLATVVGAPSALALTSVATSAGGVAVYTGTITGGASNAFAGMTVTVSGFTFSLNNGTFLVHASDATTLTLVNVAAAIETAAASVLLPPYYIDTLVMAGRVYSYEITAVVSGVESLDSVEILSTPVPYPPSPVAVPLGVASSFEVLAGSTITNTGSSTATGDIGVFPGTSITGFPPGLVAGVIHSADYVAAAAQSDATAAFNAAMALTPTAVLSASSYELGGTTVTPGVYSIGSSAAVTGVLNLDAGGNPNAVFIFQIGSTLTTASANSAILLLNGAQAQNVFWIVGSSATLNGSTYFDGTVIAQASITVNANVNINGRLLARTGAVTLTGPVTLTSFLTGPLALYSSSGVVALGTIIFNCASQSFQQAIVGGTTGASGPTFSNVVGTITHDGSVTWVTLDPPAVQSVSLLPPSPPNTPPAPPAAPLNPRVSSDV